MNSENRKRPAVKWFAVRERDGSEYATWGHDEIDATSGFNAELVRPMNPTPDESLVPAGKARKLWNDELAQAKYRIPGILHWRT